jgi:formate hydrogenlyase subunit 6/NADH:ubiquinone oxidoreductase subunit I
MAIPGRALFVALKTFLTKPVTRLYPFVKAEVDSNFRGKMEFVQDKCIGCKMCVRDCPARAIEITLVGSPEVKKDADGKPLPRKFKCDINLGRCVTCAQCVESCPKDALFITQEFEHAAFKQEDLIRKYGKDEDK